MTPHDPPRLARAIASRLLPPPFRDAILGDWAEQFHDERTTSPYTARWNYWRHLFSIDLIRLRRATNARITEPTAMTNQTPTLAMFIDGLWRDTRVAVRSLLRDRVFSVTAVVVLGLGLGAGTTVFSVINGVLRKPLEYSNPDELVAIWGARPGDALERTPLTVWDIVNLRQNATTLADVGGFFQQGSALQSDGPATEVGFGWMSDNVLSIMGIEPMLGRSFTDEDAGQLVVILDHGIWQTRFAADSSVIGRTIRLSQQQWTVIGVLPPGKPLQLPHRGHIPAQTDVWSLVTLPTENPDATVGWMRAVGRLKTGTTVQQAQEELQVLAQSSVASFPDRGEAGFELHVTKLLEDFTQQASQTLWLLSGAAGLLLLIVLTNVANLMLLRGAMRRHITAIRKAFGANRWRIVQLVCLEGALLSALGTALGVGIALGVHAWIKIDPPPGLPRVENLQVDATVIAFAALLAFTSMVVFGLVPGVVASRRSVEGVLRRSTGAAASLRRVSVLVIAEVALSVALLVGSGLLVRTMSKMAAVDPGFRTDNILTFRLSLPNQDMTPEQIANVARRFEERVDALPGADAVGLTHALPLSGALATGSYALTIGDLATGDDGVQVNYRFVSPGFLPTIEATLVSGTHLSDRSQPHEVVIDTEFARTLWPDNDAVGRSFAANPLQRGAAEFTVVGVVNTLRNESLREAGRPTVYFSTRHYTPLYIWATIRTGVDPVTLVAPIRTLLPQVHPDLAMARVKTMSDWVSESSASTRWAAWVMTVFGIVAALLSAIGLYGVLGHFVTGHKKEIGIRLAIGADRAGVLKLILRSAFLVVGFGLLLGVVGSVWLSRSLESFLFGISRVDVASYMIGIGTLAAITVFAAWIPASRATRISPMITLREET